MWFREPSPGTTLENGAVGTKYWQTIPTVHLFYVGNECWSKIVSSSDAET